MKAATFIALAQTVLRKFRHAEHAPCAAELPDIISNPKTGAIGIGCRKCARVILLTAAEGNELSPIVQAEEQVKPRFKI